MSTPVRLYLADGLRLLAALSALSALPPALAADAAGASGAAVAAAPAGEAAPDGMGHLHAQADGGEAPPAAAHHRGSAAPPAAGGEADADSCPMEADGHDAHGGHDGHDGMTMHGMEGMHGSGDGHGDHGAHHRHGDGDDAALAGIAAPPPPSWLHGIDLSEEQQDRIFAILHEVAPAQRKAMRTAEATHQRLRHAGMATDYAEATTRKLSEQHAQAIGELTLLRVHTERRILEVLSAEQRRMAAHQAAHGD